jgi:hypothetical protein
MLSRVEFRRHVRDQVKRSRGKSWCGYPYVEIALGQEGGGDDAAFLPCKVDDHAASGNQTLDRSLLPGRWQSGEKLDQR